MYMCAKDISTIFYWILELLRQCDNFFPFYYRLWGLSWSYLDLQLPVQSVPITTNVVSSNPVHGEVYSKQHYMIKFVSDSRQVSGFLRVLRFPHQ
jgi:hypothetical protein